MANEEVTDIYVRNNVDVRNTIKVCEPCFRKDRHMKAHIYCNDCKQFQCKECMNAHTVFDDKSDHTFVTMGTAKLAEVNVDIADLDYCKVHKKEITRYCCTDDVTCCSECADEEHQGCITVLEISRVAKDQQRRIDKTLKALTTTEHCAKGLLHDYEKAPVALKSQLGPILDLIESIKLKLVGKCNALKASVTKCYSEKEIEYKADIAHRVSICRKMVEDLDSRRRLLSVVADHGSDEQKFLAFCGVEQEVLINMETLGAQNMLPNATLFLVQTPALKEIIKSTNPLATLQVNGIVSGQGQFGSPSDSCY